MEILVRFITCCGNNLRTYLRSEMPNGKIKKKIGTFLYSILISSSIAPNDEHWVRFRRTRISSPRTLERPSQLQRASIPTRKSSRRRNRENGPHDGAMNSCIVASIVFGVIACGSSIVICSCSSK